MGGSMHAQMQRRPPRARISDRRKASAEIYRFSTTLPSQTEAQRRLGGSYCVAAAHSELSAFPSRPRTAQRRAPEQRPSVRHCSQVSQDR